MPLHLLTVPGEIRNRIYRLVLNPEKLCHPYRYHAHNCGCPNWNHLPPQVQLLRVSKQVQKEATTLLYGESTFYLCTGYDAMMFMANVDHCCENHVPTPENLFRSRHLIRELSLCIIPEYASQPMQAQRVQDFWADPDFCSLSKRRRIEILHAHECYRTVSVWRDLGRLLAQLEALEVLTLDVEQAFCPYGCCRLTRSVINSFRDIYLLKTAKSRRLLFRIENALDDTEKNKLINGLVSDDWSEGETSDDDSDSSEDDDSESDDDDSDKSNGDDDDADRSDIDEQDDGEKDQKAKGKKTMALAKSNDRSKPQPKQGTGTSSQWIEKILGLDRGKIASLRSIYYERNNAYLEPAASESAIKLARYRVHALYFSWRPMIEEVIECGSSTKCCFLSQRLSSLDASCLAHRDQAWWISKKIWNKHGKMGDCNWTASLTNLPKSLRRTLIHIDSEMTRMFIMDGDTLVETKG